MVSIFRIHNSFFFPRSAESRQPMTMRRPDVVTVGQWLLKDFSLKTIVVSVLAIAAFAYRHANQISVVQATTNQRFADQAHLDEDLQKRLDAQREGIRAKVDKETYEADRARLSEQLQGIQLSLNTIQQVLMQHK